MELGGGERKRMKMGKAKSEAKWGGGCERRGGARRRSLRGEAGVGRGRPWRPCLPGPTGGGASTFVVVVATTTFAVWSRSNRIRKMEKTKLCRFVPTLPPNTFQFYHRPANQTAPSQCLGSSGEGVEVDQTVPAAGGERVGLEGIPRHTSHVVRVPRERITVRTRTHTHTHNDCAV